MKRTPVILILTTGLFCTSFSIENKHCAELSPNNKMIPVEKVATDNIIENSDFNTDLSSWWLYVWTDEGATANMEMEDGWCVLSNLTVSDQPSEWHIQLIQSFTSGQIAQLETGTTYILSFDACAESNNRPCYVYFGLDGDPWTAYVAENILIGDMPETFRFEFALSTIFPTIKLSFNLGQDDIEVKFDNVILEQKPTEQAPQHQVISTSGKYFENSSGSISFTLCEPVITTLSEGDNILTQGFHQSEITVIPEYIHPALQFEIAVYPNPAHDYVILKTDQITGLFYILYTIKGEAIQQNILVKDQTEIDFSTLLPSIYFLKVIEGDKELKTFKIIKK